MRPERSLPAREPGCARFGEGIASSPFRAAGSRGGPTISLPSLRWRRASASVAPADPRPRVGAPTQFPRAPFTCGPSSRSSALLSQTNYAKYKNIPTAFKLIVQEQGILALYKGWLPTLLGYSAQGAFKFGLYEYFKKCVLCPLALASSSRPPLAAGDLAPDSRPPARAPVSRPLSTSTPFPAPPATLAPSGNRK